MLNMIDVPVSYVPDLFDMDYDSLRNALPLVRHGNVPRAECWMNDFDAPYTYGSGKNARTYASIPWVPVVNKMRHDLNKSFPTSFNCCFINEYKDQHDHLGWHADDSPEMDQYHPIASVSIGAEREIWFRKPGEKGQAQKGLLLGNGSVAVMHAGMQSEWLHRIPKNSSVCGPRISLTFRKLLQTENSNV